MAILRWRRVRVGALARTVTTPSANQALIGISAVDLAMPLLQALMAGSSALLDENFARWRGKGWRSPSS